MKKLIIALVIMLGTCSFNAHASIDKELANLLGYFGIEFSTRSTKPRDDGW